MKYKFKELEEPRAISQDIWYSLTEGGYLQPSDILANEEQIDEVHKAIDIVYQFICQARNAGVIEEC